VTGNPLARSLAEALDPVQLAKRSGMTADPWQRDVLRSPSPRILLCCSRQVGKSTLAAVKATHTALHEPGSLTLLVAPSQRQAIELFKSVLRLYRTLGRPVTAEAENAMSLTLENGSRVVTLPADERTIRGFAAVKLILLDEAARVSDDLYGAIRPMLAVSGGQLMVMSTPFGRRGWFYRAATTDAGWERHFVNATDCPRIKPQFLMEERDALGEQMFLQEYMCEFVDATGSVFDGLDLEAMAAGIPRLDPFTVGR